MKHTQRILSLLLTALILIASMVVPASAQSRDELSDGMWMLDPETKDLVPCQVLNETQQNEQSLSFTDKAVDAVQTVKRGDFNGNGTVDSNDAALLRNAYLTWDGVTNAASILASADVNGNEKLDSNDYILIRLDILGISSLNPEPELDRFASDWGYTYLSTLQNGANMQALYEVFEENCYEFHTSETIDLSGDPLYLQDGQGNQYTMFEVLSVNVSELGLTANEAYATWSVFKYDHPLYYWISMISCNGVTNGDSVFYMLTTEPFTTPQERTQINQTIYDTVDEIEARYADETEPYRIALAIHDEICATIDYAYQSDGVTPSNTEMAHSIYGFFADDEGVCECYAKTFSLFMNYYGIGNIHVTNDTHAFNLIQLDGAWYWVDATFDDAPNWGEGMVHFFFCVNDTDNIYRDFPAFGEATFLSVSGHEIIETPTIDANISYLLPPRAETSYSCDAVMIGETFQVGGFTYMINGYYYARPVPYYSNVTYPSTVSYRGRVYFVPAR